MPTEGERTTGRSPRRIENTVCFGTCLTVLPFATVVHSPKAVRRNRHERVGEHGDCGEMIPSWLVVELVSSERLGQSLSR